MHFIVDFLGISCCFPDEVRGVVVASITEDAAHFWVFIYFSPTQCFPHRFQNLVPCRFFYSLLEVIAYDKIQYIGKPIILGLYPGFYGYISRTLLMFFE